MFYISAYVEHKITIHTAFMLIPLIIKQYVMGVDIN